MNPPPQIPISERSELLRFVRTPLHLLRRFLRPLFFLSAFLATLVALFYAEENVRGKRAWNAYVREQTAKGAKLHLAEFIPPPVPDDQNLALCPLLKPILDIEYNTVTDGRLSHQVSGIRHWRDTNGLNRLQRLDRTWSVTKSLDTPRTGESYVAHEERRRESGELLNQLGQPVLTNGWIDLAGWQAYYRTGPDLAETAPGASPAKDVLLALRHLDPDLTELQQEAARRPLARWPIFYDTNAPWSIMLPHLARAKGIVALLQLRSAAFLAEGETERGLADLDLGFRLAETCDEPILISQLVRDVCCSLLTQPLKEGLARHQFSEAQLAALQQKLGSVDLLAAYQHSMRAEQSWNSEWNRYARQAGHLNWTQIFGNSELGDTFNWVFAFARYAPSGWIYRNQLTLVRFHDQFSCPAVDVAARRVFPEVAQEMDASLARMTGPFSVMAAKLLVSLDFSSFVRKFAHGQTELNQAVIACALERHRLVQGAYPESLHALAPRFIERIPHDLLSGQLLQYRRTQDGRYVLVSVGWPEKGEHARDRSKGWLGRSMEIGDWAWQLPTKR